MAPPVLKALGSVHEHERLVFSKLMDMKLDVTLSKLILALFMNTGYIEYVSYYMNDAHFLSRVVSWARTVLSSVLSYHWILRRGVYDTYRGVCSVVFEDILEERGLRGKKEMNPNAREWCPSDDVEEESRFLFITFSRGFPVSSYQIRLFFTWWFGPYVETIYVHRRGGGVPLFGKIVFKFSSVPYLILNGRDYVEFLINGRTLRCKKYRKRISSNSS